MAPPISKHEQDPKAKNEVRSELKYNLEDKSAKRQTGKGFEVNNYPKLDTLIHNLRLFMNIVVSIKSGSMPPSIAKIQFFEPKILVNCVFIRDLILFFWKKVAGDTPRKRGSASLPQMTSNREA